MIAFSLPSVVIITTNYEPWKKKQAKWNYMHLPIKTRSCWGELLLPDRPQCWWMAAKLNEKIRVFGFLKYLNATTITGAEWRTRCRTTAITRYKISQIILAFWLLLTYDLLGPGQTRNVWRPNTIKQCLVTRHANVEVSGQTVKTSLIKHRSNNWYKPLSKRGRHARIKHVWYAVVQTNKTSPIKHENKRNNLRFWSNVWWP